MEIEDKIRRNEREEWFHQNCLELERQEEQTQINEILLDDLAPLFGISRSETTVLNM